MITRIRITLRMSSFVTVATGLNFGPQANRLCAGSCSTCSIPRCRVKHTNHGKILCWFVFLFSRCSCLRISFHGTGDSRRRVRFINMSYRLTVLPSVSCKHSVYQRSSLVPCSYYTNALIGERDLMSAPVRWTVWSSFLVL